MRIWFNHWFSTAYYFIKSLRESGHYVIATNERDSCVYKMICDEFFLEAVMSPEEYVEGAINFCKQHRIDIFFCKRHMDIIAKNKEKFTEIGVTVIVEDYENIKMFESKINSSIFIKEHNICRVPEMFVCKTYDEFTSKYSRLKNDYPNICMKFDIDEGGQSFKKIIPNSKKYNFWTLQCNDGFSIREQDLFNILCGEYNFRPIIIMPYLSGTEYSIDCLNTKQGLVAVPRGKISNRVTKLVKDREMINMARKFQLYANFNSAYNIQLKEDEKGELYFLEVNTRLSGGAWKDKFVGIDFPKLLIDKFLDTPINVDELYNNFTDINISNIENAIVLS